MTDRDADPAGWVEHQESIAEDRANPPPPGPIEAEQAARAAADRYERWLMGDPL